MAEEEERFCFLRISIAGAKPETLVISLYSKECPTTCRNFEHLCASKAIAAKGSSNNNEATYRGTEFHRILPAFMVQGGDFEHFDGTGGYCYETGGTFKDESFVVQHDREGVVSMANRGPNTNGSQFFITLAKTPHLNGKHVAFGQVVEGMDTVRKIAQVETEGTRPVALQRVVVVDCGVGKGNVSSCESSEASLENNRKRERKKKSHKKKKHRKRCEENSDDESSDGERHRKKKRKRSRSERHHKRKHRSKESKKRHKDR